MYVYIYIYNIYLYLYLYIVIKEKTNKIFKVKIFRLLPLSFHNISLYKSRFESHIRLNSYRARYKVAQGTSRTRFNFWQYTNNNDNIEIRVKQINNDNNNNNITNTNNDNDKNNKINSNSDNIETTTPATI